MLFNRRTFNSLSLISLLFASTAQAQGSAVFRLAELGKALGDAAEAVGKLADSIAKIVGLGSTAWDHVSVRRTRSRLIALSAGISQVRQSQTVVISSLEDYISARRGDLRSGNVTLSRGARAEYESAWKYLTDRIGSILLDVKSLLKSVEDERSDFVLSDEYNELIQLFGQRIDLLSKLRAIPAPLNKNDIDSLDIVTKNYEKLHLNLRVALKNVNNYIKSIPK
jgi:hypothetical protein